MKKGTKRLLLFEIIILLILLFNSFVFNILSGLNLSLFLFIILIIFKIIFGFEKDKHRVTTNVILDIIICVLVFLISYYLLGIIIGFAKVGNYFTKSGLRDYIFPLILSVIFKEYLRNNILKKSEFEKSPMYLSIIMFLLIDITNSIFYGNFSDGEHIFKFFALIVLPSISYNIFATYVNKNAGYKPIIIYSLVIGLYPYIIPIVPNSNEYLTSIINFLLPIVVGYKIYNTVKNENDEQIVRDYNKRHYISLIVSSLIVGVLVYFSSGYFSYYGIAIATGSMSPTINRGDVVIVHKTKDIEKLEVGDIIAYEYHGVIVVHRLANKVKVDEKYYLYSKGDANESNDNYIIEEDMVIGTTNFKIPYIGMPTVWLNELWEDRK